MALEGVNLCAKIALVEKSESLDNELGATRLAFSDLKTALNETTTIPVDDFTAKLEEDFEMPEGMSQGHLQDTIPSTVTDRAREMVTALLIIPIRQWKEATKAQELRDKLKAVVGAETKKATEAALMEVDGEPNLSDAKINDLIKQAVTKKTATLRKEIAKLKSDAKTHPKGSRGRRQGASEKEKNGKSQKTPKKTNKTKKVHFDDNDSAGDDANASKPKGILRKPRYQKSPTPKRGSKNNGRRNGNNSSRRK